MILSCGPSSRAPSPTTLEKTVWRANRTCTLEAKNIRDFLGFRNYYSLTLLPESAIGPTITSVQTSSSTVWLPLSWLILIVSLIKGSTIFTGCFYSKGFFQFAAKTTLKMICFPKSLSQDLKLVWRVYMKTRRRQEKPVRSLHVLFNFKMAVTPDRTLHLLQITRTIVKYAYLFITIISLLSSRTIAESTKGEHYS